MNTNATNQNVKAIFSSGLFGAMFFFCGIGPIKNSSNKPNQAELSPEH